MRMWLIGSLIVIIAIILVVFADARRLVQTVILIAQVQPYERMIAGAPAILIAGDSTGYGTGASAGTKSVAGYLGADFPQYSIKNISVNGRTVGGLAKALANLPADAHYKLILLQIGGNDILQKRPLTEVEEELRTALRIAHQHSDQVVMMSSGNVGAAPAFATNGQPDSEYEAVTREMQTMFKRVTAEESAAYVDLFLEPNEDVFLQEPKRYLAMDGIHPNAAGYYFWYQTLKPVIEPLLANN